MRSLWGPSGLKAAAEGHYAKTEFGNRVGDEWSVWREQSRLVDLTLDYWQSSNQVADRVLGPGLQTARRAARGGEGEPRRSDHGWPGQQGNSYDQKRDDIYGYLS